MHMWQNQGSRPGLHSETVCQKQTLKVERTTWAEGGTYLSVAWASRSASGSLSRGTEVLQRVWPLSPPLFQ